MTILQQPIKHTYAIKQRARIDLSLSENPLGSSYHVIKAIINSAENLSSYPCEEGTLIALIAKHHNISEDTILLGAGANQLLEDILKIYAMNKRIVVPSASFPESVACMATLQGGVDRVPLQADLKLNLSAMLAAVKPDTAFIHLCNPNNPTGIWTNKQLLLELAKLSPVPLLISEAGADFIGDTLIQQNLPHNIIVVRSFSKAYGIAGMRIGYCVAAPAIISQMQEHLRSYRVSSLAIAAAMAALQDQTHLQESIAYILQEKEWLMNEMQALGFTLIPSQGQSFIAQVPYKFSNADNFCKIAHQYGVGVVNCSLYEGLEQYIRISPQTHETNKNFILILKKIMET